jgi:hypothetical protein
MPTTDITIYRITGKQGPLVIPHRFCEECDLTIAATRRVLDELANPSRRLMVRPWFLWWWRVLPRGGWHAPIVTVHGRVVSQGVVPTRARLLAAIQAARADAPRQTDQQSEAT